MAASDPVNSEMFSCDGARRRLISYQEGRLPLSEMHLMRRHLASCPACAEESGPVSELRRNIRSLPVRPISSDLRDRLKVVASREASRRRSRLNLQTVLRVWKADLKLMTDNLMRPFALPTAGGFASALVLFSIFASGITIPTATASNVDVPTGLYTEASVKNYLPIGFDGTDLIVDVTIDDQGRVIDYTLPNVHSLQSDSLRRHIGHHLLFTQFNPATSFGMPTGGKVRLWFRSSRIDVKG